MPLGKEQSKRLAITISSGSGTGTITNAWEFCRWLRIKPVNETDIFNLTISDGDGQIMISRTNVTGSWSEKVEMSLGIMQTISITNATTDGVYILKADLH